MGQKLAKLPAGVEVTALAGRQHGVITRAQLNALGLSDRAIQGRMRAGWLHRVDRAVYAVETRCSADTAISRPLSLLSVAGRY